MKWVVNFVDISVEYRPVVTIAQGRRLFGLQELRAEDGREEVTSRDPLFGGKLSTARVGRP